MRTGITVDEALEAVLEAAIPLSPETVTVAEALGRVLAEAVVSTRTLPPADNSAMDGYAVRAKDLRGATAARPRELPVVFEVAAGGAPDRGLAPGEAARIFTGAPLPPGSDTVVRQEDSEAEGGSVRIGMSPPSGEYVRRAGEDVQAGETVLEPGDRVAPAEVGLLASLGRSVVAVHQRPTVAILSGGDELVEPDGDVSGGRIVSSNSYSLAAQCAEAGALSRYLGIARDTPEALEHRLRAGLSADLVVSSAGVSVGDRDYVRPVLEKLGCRIVFWGVEMKPGYPIVFGRFGETGPLVFGLPGNPVSTMVTFEQFVRPLLRRLAGHRFLSRPTVRARLGETLRKKPGRLHFVRVRLERQGEDWAAKQTGNQSSGVLRSMTLAQGLLIFPREAEQLAEGSLATVQVLDDDVFCADPA